VLAVTKAIERAGHITSSRLSTFTGGSTKALGLGRDFHCDENKDDQYDNGAIFSNTLVSGSESFSEAPRSVFESAYELIIAGFHPLKLRLLYNKIQRIVTD
jgi:RNA-dependent RNA polymerase